LKGAAIGFSSDLQRRDGAYHAALEFPIAKARVTIHLRLHPSIAIGLRECAGARYE